jgi:stage IV sporulation protein FB
MGTGQDLNASSTQIVDLKNDLIPQLQHLNETKSKFSSLTLLIVTVVLFFSAHIISLKWQQILILVGVLFFHELGHLFAMKLFKYTDIKMFFIPFIGAAVSAQKQKDSAARSCIVSLMGPLPGMFFGVLLYILFRLTKNYYTLKTAQVMLLLNAFNFLPIMPLDGGKYIDVLFINRRYFRLLFAFFGAGLFLFLAVSGKDFFLGVIGAFVVFSALSNFKIHGISRELKSEGVNATSINDLLADERSIQLVVDKIYAKAPKLFMPKVNYQAILNQLNIIVDTLKFIPAKLLSKSILLLSYVTIVLASIIVTIFFISMDYTEKARTEYSNGKQYVIAERYVHGNKISECPINDSLFYDGKGTAFGPGSALSPDTFYYSNGYRMGEWLSFNEAGDMIEKRVYSKGHLLSISTNQDGTWMTTPFSELSLFTKVLEEIQRISQPFKSNHKYFEK